MHGGVLGRYGGVGGSSDQEAIRQATTADIGETHTATTSVGHCKLKKGWGGSY